MKKWYEKYMIVIGFVGQYMFFIQAYKIFNTRSASDLSASGFIVSMIAIVSWFIYGIILKNAPLILSNILAIVGVVAVLIGIYLHG